MIKRVLGRTGFEVTVLGHGGAQLVGEFGIDPKHSEEVYNYAMESEINFFATAEMYGYGESEELVGRALHRYPKKKAYISDNIGYLNERTCTRMLLDEAYVNEREIRRALKHSLWLLQRDNFDIVCIHEPDWPLWSFNYETGDSVILSVLESWKKEGLIAAIGVAGIEFDKSTQLINTGRIDVALVAYGISLLHRPMFNKLVPAAKKNNTGIFVGAVLGQNNEFLTAIKRNELPRLLSSIGDVRKVKMGKKLEKLYDIADELNINMIEMALRYVLSYEDIHSNIAGAKEISHIRDNISYIAKGPLDKEIVDAINKIQDEFAIEGDDKLAELTGGPLGVIQPLGWVGDRFKK
jgi:aryl-alcohol dehydrogenase-like predicted oxidoreductase